MLTNDNLVFILLMMTFGNSQSVKLLYLMKWTCRDMLFVRIFFSSLLTVVSECSFCFDIVMPPNPGEFRQILRAISDVGSKVDSVASNVEILDGNATIFSDEIFAKLKQFEERITKKLFDSFSLFEERINKIEDLVSQMTETFKSKSTEINNTLCSTPSSSAKKRKVLRNPDLSVSKSNFMYFVFLFLL
jgi:hypothetical protein